jgi:hypothetical protein
MTAVEACKHEERSTPAASPVDEGLDASPDTYLDCVQKSDVDGMQRCVAEALKRLKEKQDCLGIFFEQAHVCAKRQKLAYCVVELIETHWQWWTDALLTAAHEVDMEADRLRENARHMRAEAKRHDSQKRRYCGDEDEGKQACKKQCVSPPSSPSSPTA